MVPGKRCRWSVASPTTPPCPSWNDLAIHPTGWGRRPNLSVRSPAGPPHSLPGRVGILNTNFVLLGLLAQNVSGQPYDRLIQDRIFAPLQMSGCSMPAAIDRTIPSPYSRGYQLSTTWDRKPTPPAPLPDLADVTDNNPSWGFGTGQVICTATDLETWARALATGQLLSPRMQAERLDWYTIRVAPARVIR